MGKRSSKAYTVKITFDRKIVAAVEFDSLIDATDHYNATSPPLVHLVQLVINADRTVLSEKWGKSSGGLKG